MGFLLDNYVVILFMGLVAFLATGFPVAFGLAATGLAFGWVGTLLGLFPSVLFQALPLRIFGIMQNDTLLAVPFFTLMGIILQRSGMAEDLLDTIGQVFGKVRGGIAVAVVLVGALLAATTGVVSAAVISMGLISLPVMLRYGYNRSLALGVISASGTLAQIIPPSLVLIVMADQLGQPAGDLFAGAIAPSLTVVSLYLLFLIVLAVVRPAWIPALPPDALIYHEDNGSTGHRSLLVILIVSFVAGYAWTALHIPFVSRALGRAYTAAQSEILIFAIVAGAFTALLIAAINRVLRANLLSRLAEKVVFALIPPLVLIFLVLGTIFLGIATPTEAGAIGATGALIMAVVRRSLSWKLFMQALDQTTLLTCFVMFIVIGATVFSFTFNAVDGNRWVINLFDKLPGGELGFLLFVNLVVFVLGMFLDYFEIAFIIIPILVPVAESLGIDLVWFGVLISMNLQASFLTPPFGYALFYLRSVAPRNDYKDRVTGVRIRGITTGQIYKGSIIFLILQMMMVGVLIVYPDLVLNSLDRLTDIDLDSVKLEVDSTGYGESQW